MRNYLRRLQVNSWQRRILPIVGAALLIVGVADSAWAQNWQAVPLRTVALKNAGKGGEGCQWPQALAIDNTGSFLLFGTDVGGIFRSRDGGDSWEPCNVGYTPRGTSGLAIDPNNNSRAIAVGANSASSDFHGLYLTTNQAASWANALPLYYSGYRDERDQVAFDKSVIESGYSKYVYWSGPDGKLYWSQNGGAAWSVRNANYGMGFVKVNPNNGYVYVGNGTALYRSTDRGLNFTQQLAGAVQGLEAVGNKVWVSKQGGVWYSSNSGGSFSKRTGTNLPTTVPLRNLRVHPGNNNYMLVVGDHDAYDKRIYYSSNGGTSWTQGGYDNADSFMPYNNRLQIFAWNPTNASIAHSFGGDWITKTTNSGATWKWNANGYNGVVVGGRFNFSSQAANFLMVSIKDYNGAWTSDGGDTWTYENISGQGWGGFTFGGGGMYYADNAESILWTGDSTTTGSVRTLKIKRSGWADWSTVTDSSGNAVTWGGSASNGQDVSLTDPGWFWVSFAGNWRTDDRGWHWSAMPGCDGVFTYSQTTKNLFGVKYSGSNVSVVTSADHGVNWQATGGTLTGYIADVAVGVTPSGGERVYIAHDDTLQYWDTGVSSAWTTVDAGLKRDQWGWHRVRTVATDPQDLKVVYIGSSRDVYSTWSSVQRSTNCADANSWTTLTVSNPLTASVKDGGREALHIRVHPVTRQAWVATSCYGIWKIDHP